MDVVFAVLEHLWVRTKMGVGRKAKQRRRKSSSSFGRYPRLSAVKVRYRKHAEANESVKNDQFPTDLAASGLVEVSLEDARRNLLRLRLGFSKTRTLRRQIASILTNQSRRIREKQRNLAIAPNISRPNGKTVKPSMCRSYCIRITLESDGRLRVAHEGSIRVVDDEVSFQVSCNSPQGESVYNTLSDLMVSQSGESKECLVWMSQPEEKLLQPFASIRVDLAVWDVVDELLLMAPEAARERVCRAMIWAHLFDGSEADATVEALLEVSLPWRSYSPIEILRKSLLSGRG
jgi:hypothetical protein